MRGCAAPLPTHIMNFECILVKSPSHYWEVVFYNPEKYVYHNSVGTISADRQYTWNYYTKKDLGLITSECEKFLEDFIARSGGLRNLDRWEWGCGKVPAACFGGKQDRSLDTPPAPARKV